jgi:glycosyltransferase involved in cell wall biosynthesis
MDIAIVTTCKGRLAHLRQTLPHMIATGFRVTVVDYDCPESTAAFVTENFPTATVLRVDHRPNFNLAEARNLGARASRGRHILFLDSDTVVSEGFAEQLRNLLITDDRFYVGGEQDLHGVCLVPHGAFEVVGGYDEVIEGWGYEDEDFYQRLQFSGLFRNTFDGGLIAAIRHPDTLRGVTPGQDRWALQRINAVYSRAKNELEALIRRRLTVEERKFVRSSAKQAIEQSVGTGSSQSFVFNLGRVDAVATAEDARNGAYTLDSQIVFTVKIPPMAASASIGAIFIGE